jgi:hypothetical protein
LKIFNAETEVIHGARATIFRHGPRTEVITKSALSTHVGTGRDHNFDLTVPRARVMHRKCGPSL